MRVSISTRHVALALYLGAAMLLICFLVGQYFALYLGHPHVFGLVDLFDLNREGNVPAFYSSVLLLLGGGLLILVGHAKRRQSQPWARHWLGLGVIFLFLSLDENVALHEGLTDPVRSALSPEGVLNQVAWVIPYAILLVTLAATYLRFLVALPSRARNLFIVAGTLYVGGAMGVEFLGGVHHELLGKQLDGSYVMLIALEETMEMAGIITLIVAVLSYIKTEMPDLRVGIETAACEQIERPSTTIDDSDIGGAEPALLASYYHRRVDAEEIIAEELNEQVG